jgi:hypothetical protein
MRRTRSCGSDANVLEAGREGNEGHRGPVRPILTCLALATEYAEVVTLSG